MPTVPITRSERERPNKITYYLASMTQKDERVVVDLDLMNGLGRGFSAVTVWVTLLGPQGEKHRVPYPLGFYSRGLDGRIDDPEAGWKGRGVWADFGTNIPWHIEGGVGTTSKIVKFQIRPDPLAY